MDTNLQATPLLNFEHPAIEALVRSRGWADLPVSDRINAAYLFVRDEVAFGYNTSDDLPASEVLADGYGQCNTKTTLLMALLRALDVPVRFHGATIHKELQRGVVTGLLYRLAPTDILHSWAEVWFDDRWTGLEGVILDAEYLDGVRTRFPNDHCAFLGYGIGTESLANPPIDWIGNNTAIQATGVNNDFGIFDSPDRFYAERGTNLSGWKAWTFRHLVRNIMNRNVAAMRAEGTATAEFAGKACAHKRLLHRAGHGSTTCH